MTNDNTTEETISLDYDLASLPTAQHKAGLAGLVLFIRTLEMRHITPAPEIRRLDRYGATIATTRQALQTVFDDLFDAEWVEVKSTKRPEGSQVKRTEMVPVVSEDGRTKQKRHYVYDVVQPRGAFLAALYPADGGGWIKLWRDALWATLRARPKARGVYKERADGEASSEAHKAWRALQTAQTAEKNVTEGISSSVFLGAQERNAERVKFLGTPIQSLLLHFWPVASLLFAPRAFKVERTPGQPLRLNWEDTGYVFAIPEPAHLEWFVDDAKEMLANLSTRVEGYLPRDARIALPAEGGLQYLYDLTHHRVRQRPIADVITAVEVYHLKKRDKNVATLAAERVLPDPRVLDGYEALRAHCRNPDVRACRIRSLLDGLPWYAHFAAVLESRPWEMMVRNHRSPPGIAPFGRDVRNKFEAIERNLNPAGETPMPEDTENDQLARRIYRLVGGYVNRKTEERSHIRYADFKDKKTSDGKTDYPREYLEAREKVCSDAFLAMRGRREKDFVEYFSGTICSVPQYLPEQDYLAVADALLHDWETVKTLSMLALSANS